MHVIIWSNLNIDYEWGVQSFRAIILPSLYMRAQLVRLCGWRRSSRRRDGASEPLNPGDCIHIIGRSRHPLYLHFYRDSAWRGGSIASASAAAVLGTTTTGPGPLNFHFTSTVELFRIPRNPHIATRTQSGVGGCGEG